MKKTFLLALLIVSQFLVAQSKTSEAERFDNTADYQGKGMWITSRPASSEIKGSPYLFKSWNNIAKVHIDKKSYVLNDFNYNIDKDRFEAKFSNDSVLIVNLRNVKKIVINNMSLKPFFNSETQRKSFFEELYNNDGTVLLKKYSVKIKEGSVNPMTLAKTRPDEYIKVKTYYLKKKGSDLLKKVKLKKSTILDMLGKEYANDIKGYAKKNKLKYNNANDLNKILQYYKMLSI